MLRSREVTPNQHGDLVGRRATVYDREVARNYPALIAARASRPRKRDSVRSDRRGGRAPPERGTFTRRIDLWVSLGMAASTIPIEAAAWSPGSTTESTGAPQRSSAAEQKLGYGFSEAAPTPPASPAR